MILTNLKFVVSFKFCSNPWASELFGSQLVWHRITRLNLLVNGLTQELLFSGARIPNTFGFWIVKSCSDVEWFQFGMAFQNRTARPFQIQPNSCLHGFLYFGSILNGWDYSYSCSYGPDNTNTQPFPIRTSKCSDFEWVLNFIVWYLSPHCIAINRWALIHIDII